MTRFEESRLDDPHTLLKRAGRRGDFEPHRHVLRAIHGDALGPLLEVPRPQEEGPGHDHARLRRAVAGGLARPPCPLVSHGSVRIEDIDGLAKIEDVIGLVADREEVSRHFHEFATHRFPLLDDSGSHHPDTRERDGFGLAKNGDHKADRLAILRPLEHLSIAGSENEVGIRSRRLEPAVLQPKLRSELRRLRHRDATRQPGPRECQSERQTGEHASQRLHDFDRLPCLLRSGLVGRVP